MRYLPSKKPVYQITKVENKLLYPAVSRTKSKCMFRSFKRLPVLLVAFVLIPFLSASYPQESKVNQRKINRERQKKERQAQKEYEAAVKNHNKLQSKETKSMMKQAKKDSSKNTPVRKRNALNHPGNKTCK